ncbi:MAG: L,D-transpeptidase family protein [Chloroflexota bacterium]
MPISPISRRDFLKLSASGALSLALSELGLDRLFSAPPASQGRVTWSGTPLYAEPYFKAKQLNVFGVDQVVKIKAEVEGEEGNPFNKAWYQVDDGYTYSGWLQLVETSYQKPVSGIRLGGQIGEVTVPVSETRLTPYTFAKNGYRLYYGSTHWVTNVVVTREEKSTWYEIFDNHLKKTFFVPTYNMRIVPDEELTLLSPNIPNADKLIHVDLAAQLVTCFEGQTMVISSRCASGTKGTRTPTGEFLTYHKGPSIHMTNDGDAEKNIYDLPGVPWVSFFTGIGNAFHGTYWHNDFGRPRSHGCVNLPSEVAKFIYRWTSPTVPPDTDYLHVPGQGTRVQIVESM